MWGWYRYIRNLVKPVKPTVMPATAPITRKIPLAADQYYQAAHAKTHIFLHHTAGGSAAGAIAGWSSNPENVATPYVIERTGDIYECYDPKYWAYSLGVKGATALEKAAIPIEIVSYGCLAVANRDHKPEPGKAKKFVTGNIISYTDRAIPAEEVIKLPPYRVNVNPFAGKTYATYTGEYWHRYTDAQIQALKDLLPYLIDRFKIKLQADRTDFWSYKGAAGLAPGIWSHTTVRKDKVDIFPQPELVQLIQSL